MLHGAGEVLGGHQWLCWLFCAGLFLQKDPEAPCCAVGTWGQSAPFTSHVTCAQKLCLEEVLILWHQGPPSMLVFVRNFHIK